MFRADLADGRKAWLASHSTPVERAEAEKDFFLSRVDGSGRHADFHALRHTFITGLVMGGVNPKVAQTLARHSVITLTMDRYTHLFAGNAAAALDVLPDLCSPARHAAKATGTGTDGATARLSPNLSPNGAVQPSSTQFGGVNARPAATDVTVTKRQDSGRKSLVLTDSDDAANIPASSWRGGRAVECAGFENR